MSSPRRFRALLLIIAVAAATMAVPARAETPSNPWLNRRVLSIAHAGGENEAPHESMFAYKRAAALGTDVLELDVRLAGDGTLVVHHDATVDATTEGTGRVDAMTYAELYALDHGYKFTEDRWSCGDCPEEDYIYRGVRTGDKAPPAGYQAEDFTIPSVEALFTTFPAALLDIEIKENGEPAKAAARELARLVEVHDRADRTVVVAFDQAIVDYYLSLQPEVFSSPGTDGVQQFFIDRKPQPQHQILQVPPTYNLDGTEVTVVTPEFVADAHAAGLAVWVWMNGRSQENAAFYRELIEMGVDGILGAAPAVARQVIDDLGVGWDGTDPQPSTPSSTTPITDTTTATPGGTTSNPAATGAVPVSGNASYTG
jgi:glycerophosphoryl diester phosphodiesterase